MEEAHQFPSDKICTKCVPAWDWRAASNLPGPSTHTHTFRWTILKLLFLLGDSWCPLPVDMGDMQVLCWVLAGLSAFAQGLASRADSLEWLALDFCAKGGKQKISEAGLRGWTAGSSHLVTASCCQVARNNGGMIRGINLGFACSRSLWSEVLPSHWVTVLEFLKWDDSPFQFEVS